MTILNKRLIRILNIGILIKDWLVNKIYFHRILASAITSYVFVVLFNFIIATAVSYVTKMGHTVYVCRITGQAHSLPSEPILKGLEC